MDCHVPIVPDYMPLCLPLRCGFSRSNVRPMKPLTRQVTLTLDDGPHDPPRIGWWEVTGPQPATDVYAIVELSYNYTDAEIPTREVYAWFLYRRTPHRGRRVGTYLDEIADGVGDTRDEALEQVTDAWTRLVGG